MDASDRYAHRKAVVLGLGRQGVAAAGYLAQRGARVVVSDAKTEVELAPQLQMLAGWPIEYVLGGHPATLLDGTDLLCLSGGVPSDLPIVQGARARGIAVTNDSQLFLEAAPARVVGITGSAGKTTTTALVGAMARAGVQRKELRAAWVGGNIGNPLLADVARMEKGDLAVMELSSFQLEVMAASPQVAAILNITPNHLDRHGSLEAYREAKARILDGQTAESGAVLGWDDPGARGLSHRVRGRLAFFALGPLPPEWKDGAFCDQGWIHLRVSGQATSVVARAALRLRGDHNVSNAAAACAIASLAGLSIEAMREGIEGFSGVAHRLEFVARVGEVDWYNDSIATAPERAMAALRSFREPLILLAGGRDKKLPWDAWAEMVRGRVEHLVLFGEAAGLIEKALGTVPPGMKPHSVTRCATLGEAVQAAVFLARPGDVVLLAPGGTSFDQYRDFEARGEDFRRLVRALKEGGK